MLNNLPFNEQKQMLGERLFVLVQQIEPNFAAKITGMFLEFEIKHILILIKSPKILKDKVNLTISRLNT
jgi:polyadenylate-binding protein